MRFWMNPTWLQEFDKEAGYIVKTTWKKWLGFSIYKKLWSIIGGRPWTYIMRDFYAKFEFFIIMGFFSLGYFIHPHLTTREFVILVITGTVFFILGHVLWGKKYIPNQQPERKEVDDDMIEDGFGSVWSAWCPMCAEKTISVVRPGKVQCSNCG